MHSQYKEDEIVAVILEDQSPEMRGAYIDVGCNHPYLGNNTYLLYRNGYRGICIDGHAGFAPEYEQYRPEDVFVAAVVGGVDGEARFFYKEGLEGLSSVLPSNINSETKSVRSIRLSTIVDQYNIKKIDLLSVDVEGSEIDVICSLGPYIQLPRLIVAEFNTLNAINEYLQPYLVSMGFQIIAVTDANVIATRNFAKEARLLPRIREILSR